MSELHTPLREQIARIIDPIAYEDFPVGGEEPDHDGWDREQALRKADAILALPALSLSREGWRPIETAPRDGTLFLACNLDHPSFGSWAMYRRVRHDFQSGEAVTTDLGGWVHVGDVEPDYLEGHDTGPEPACSMAPDALNTSVRYGWMPLPKPPSPSGSGSGRGDE
jgi:hypothetical protein